MNRYEYEADVTSETQNDATISNWVEAPNMLEAMIKAWFDIRSGDPGAEIVEIAIRSKGHVDLLRPKNKVAKDSDNA